MEEKIKNIINILTGKTLLEEKRILRIKVTEKECILEYKANKTDAQDILNQIKKIYTYAGEIKLLQKEYYNGPKKILGISSVKGGVGKSTISLNISLMLSQMGLKVGLLDSDIYGPSVNFLLGSDNQQAYTNKENRIIPFVYKTLKYITFASFIKKEEPVIWRGPMLNGVIKQFLYDVDWSGLDILVIDFPPGTGDVYLSILQFIDLTGVVLISTPQELSLLDTNRGLSFFNKFSVKVLGFIENMAYFLCECGRQHYLFGEDLKKKIEKPLLGSLPIDPSVATANDQGKPMVEFFQESDWVKELKVITEKILKDL